jgi:cyclin-dependent kinase 7
MCSNVLFSCLLSAKGLLDVFAGRNNVNMVLEYCITDLEEIIKDRSIILTPAEVKRCMLMIMRGVAACHQQWTLHRDLKPSNILVGADGQLKLADFGLARIHGSPNPRLTSQVITRWYRPPELLFAADQYGAGVDIWSVGCIFAELMLRMPYLPGDSDIDQLAKIFQARGTPTDDDWPERKYLSAYIPFSPCPVADHSKLFTASSTAALELLDKMLTLNPLKRPTATEVLEHAYFTSESPPPCSPESFLAKILSSNTVKQSNSSRRVGNNGAPGNVVTHGGQTSVRSPMADLQFSLGKRKLEFS